jgi:UDPglucose--hexose-1-phosphate uridylyltransferase
VPFRYEAAVFDNLFPSFRPAPPPAPHLEAPTAPARGRCEVVLYTDRHEASFGDLSPTELTRVLAVWIDRARELWIDPAHAYVGVFENRGAEVGATISHPHGQIYALDHVPPIPAAKAAAHRRHRARVGSCLSCQVTLADAHSDRVVAENESFVVAVPFAARWPFEVHVRARRHGLRRLAELSPSEQRDLAVALRDVVRRYDVLFDLAVPYMMVAQEAPADEPDWHLGFELYPLQRAPGVTKIRASVETGLGLFLNDVAPEDAARRLASLVVPAEHIELDTLFTVTQPDLAPTR